MPKKNLFKMPIVLLIAIVAFLFPGTGARAETASEKGGTRFGVIKGVVRDNKGKPISKATVTLFRVGTSKVLKQIKATSAGKFFTKVVPGTYTILAVAQGFNPVTLKKVKVSRSSELVYGFKLERSGLGKTTPEKRLDRNSPKWRIRAATRSSIYQNQEGDTPGAIDTSAQTVEKSVGIAKDEDGKEAERKGQTVVETFVTGTGNEGYLGTNFATLQPISENSELVFAGQVSTSGTALKRFETTFSFRPNKNHKVNLRGSLSNLGNVKIDSENQLLGQVSFQALDQWRIREGIILVVGLDYSRYTGAGNDRSFSPRLGFQFDIDSKTRVRSAYTTRTEPQTWQKVIELEDSQVLFRDPIAAEDIVVENNKPELTRNRRFELGVERILDGRSSLEANIFFDSVIGRGVGLANLPFDGLGGGEFGDLVASQHGKAQGLRVVYSRRLKKFFSMAAGYSFGNGQRLSEHFISNPARAFDNDFFQTFFGELKAEFKTGTSVRTIYRFSSKATVFAIDPFQGRLAIYDPGLSVIVTQDLPNWGLPINAEAVLDAKNILDVQNGLEFQKDILNLSSQQRILRGGILVRF